MFVCILFTYHHHTALLMKEVSDESKPEPNQSLIQQSLLKLKAMEDAFRERLRKDRSKQGSRPSVFSLMDEEIATHNHHHPPTTTTTTYPAPASADIIVQPKNAMNVNNRVMGHHLHHLPSTATASMAALQHPMQQQHLPPVTMPPSTTLSVQTTPTPFAQG